jgi:hypothetical protein
MILDEVGRGDVHPLAPTPGPSAMPALPRRRLAAGAAFSIPGRPLSVSWMQDPGVGMGDRRRHSWLAKVFRRVWLRGFVLPGLLVVVWVVSIFVHTVGQARGLAPRRWAVTHGVVMVNWGVNPARSGWGRVDWNLGTMLNPDGTNWSGVRSFPNLRNPTVQWDVEVHPGHVKAPIVYGAALASVPAFVCVWLRRRRVPAGHCPGCRYDLRGATGGVCPECGRAVAGLEAGAAPVGPSSPRPRR